MREIKFRIYDGSEMFYWGIGDMNGDGSSCTFPSGNLIKLQQMQYTGLKDKNGVEIYEGDICVLRHGYISDVKFINYGFGFDGFGTLSSNNGHIVVIGNIYQNKDLLN